MTDQEAGSAAVKAIGDPLGTSFAWLSGLIPEGPLRTLLYVVAGLCVVLVPLIYRYYLGVLAQGAKSADSIERQDYDRLRTGLAGDNLATRLYAKWLTAFLNGVERFFGDTHMADRTIFTRAFGLKTPPPLWTAPAFDRCLLLALIYPIATIFLIWAISGHVGPAESALNMKHDIPGWRRGLAVGAVGFTSFAFWRIVRTEGWKSWFWLFVGIPASVTVSSTVLLVWAVLALFAAIGALDGTLAFATSLSLALPFSLILLEPFPSIGLFSAVLSIFARYLALAIACVFISLVFFLRQTSIKSRSHGLFLLLFLFVMILACLSGAVLLSSVESWNTTGPLLLFLGLLTLLNAPFDWLSLGLTRALLRRGLELGSWWPYLFALIDACLAATIIALFALTMVIGVQAFDELAVRGSVEKAAVLPLPALFEGIAKNPAAAEYWWVYALLLSTMIPSLINLAIGGMALLRGIPGLGRLLLRWIPEGRDVPEYRRPLAALVLTSQMFAGIFLGIAAQGFLTWGLIFHIMPSIGLDLLWLCERLVVFDVPEKIGQLFWEFV